MRHVSVVTVCTLLLRRNAHSAADTLWSLPMPRGSHQSMRASKYAKITIEHGALTRLALVLMCVYCAEESTQNQVPQIQPHQALRTLILLLSPIHLCLYLVQQSFYTATPILSLLIMFCLACNMVFPLVILYLLIV